MPLYTFRLPAAFSSTPVTVYNSADVQQATGTTDANAQFAATLPTGDYYAKVSYGYTSYRAAGEVDRGDLDGVSESAFARRSTVVGFEAMKAALAEGVADVGVGLIGDSTGDAVDEWFYIFGSWLATQYPTYTVKHRVWSDAAQAFTAPTVIQTGTGGVERAAVLSSGGTVAAITDPGAAITGDIDIAVKLKAPTWKNGTQTIASKFGATGNRAFRFQINSSGYLIFDWTTDGSTLQTAANSLTAVPFADGAAGWVRVTLDVDNGSGGHAIAFYTSTDGITWTQLGTTITRATGVTSLFNAAFNYEVGARTSTSEPLLGGARIYEVEIRDGINGPTVCPRLATLWARGSGTGAATTEGAPVLTLVNGSMPGAGVAYLGETTRVKKMTPDYGQLVQFFSDSHNEAGTIGAQWVALIASLVNAVKARLPYAAPVLLTQNPRYAPANQIDFHAIRRTQTLGWARQNGYSVIDTYAAFLADGRGSALINADGIHPTQSANGGATVWANAVKAPLA